MDPHTESGREGREIMLGPVPQEGTEEKEITRAESLPGE